MAPRCLSATQVHGAAAVIGPHARRRQKSTVLRVASPFPGILKKTTLETQLETLGRRIWSLKRRMVAKNGKGIDP